MTGAEQGDDRADHEGMNRPGILIIDDDVNLRKTLAAILQRQGYDVTVAGSGAEGVALFQAQPANLVLIDLGLPDMTGMKVLEKIKECRPSTEAIILTGNASLETAIEATNRGAFSYLLKPYEIEQLIINAKRAIEKQNAEDEIIRRSRELQQSNMVLTALHKIAQVLSQTIDMEMLLTDVLHTLTETEIFRFEDRGAAFLLRGDMLCLAASIGLSGSDLEPCGNLGIGECLCGIVAGTGEIVVSGDSLEDGRHIFGDHTKARHGHVVLPLKTVDTVVGVLCLYTLPGAAPGEGELKLLTTLGNQIGIAVNNARLYEEARYDSLQDPLTGLGNRRSLQIQIEKSIESAKRYGEKLSIIMLDIDHFKRYNDVNGHIEGDRLLMKLAGILSHEMRKTDYIFRYGGEEFLAILPETDLDSAFEAAERMRKAVEAKAGVTISLGIASCRKEMRDSTSLLRSADAALYRAKQLGRNRVEAAI
ncbi:MAG TPA: diguanylate cyclase [Geobacteraceae bacterium]|nr:diguanylate cyclase [Geobacteraceae bacterium]